MGVLGDKDGPAFSYTIGNHLQGLPELLVIGPSTGRYLDSLSMQMVKRGRAFDHGEIINIGLNAAKFGFTDNDKLRVKIVNASRKANEEYTIQAGQYFETEDYAVQQVILSDNEGRFPGEKGCAEGFADIPILSAQIVCH
jgi:Domain of unknown function (DUF4262)